MHVYFSRVIARLFIRASVPLQHSSAYLFTRLLLQGVADSWGDHFAPYASPLAALTSNPDFGTGPLGDSHFPWRLRFGLPADDIRRQRYGFPASFHYHNPWTSAILSMDSCGTVMH